MANLQYEPDEEIVKLAKNGDEFATEYLISKYKNFVRVKAKSYFLVGADREDIIQEGMIGLRETRILCFDPRKLDSTTRERLAIIAAKVRRRV